jgi:hypothetical protein
MVGYDQALAPSYARWKSAHPAGDNNKGVASAANSGAFSHTSGCRADDTSPAIRFQTWGACQTFFLRRARHNEIIRSFPIS